MTILAYVLLYLIAGTFYGTILEYLKPTDLQANCSPEDRAQLEAAQLEDPTAYKYCMLGGQISAFLIWLPFWPLDLVTDAFYLLGHLRNRP
jgi:hypothetical protein